MRQADPNISNLGVHPNPRATESEDRLMGIIGSATDAIITVDDAQKITLFNSAAEQMFRCPAVEAIGKPLDRFIPARFREVHRDHIRIFGETGVTARAMAAQRPLAALRADGVEFPVEATISQITVGGQRLFTAIVRDVSERKRAEEALRESEGRLRAIVETAVDAIITIDEEGHITSFNPAATRLFGYSPAEAVGKNVNLMMPAPYRQEHDTYLKNYSSTGVKKIIGIGREVIGRRKDGTQFPIDLAVSETLLGDRRIFTGIVRDISERKSAEEMQAKLAAIVESSADAIIGKTLQGVIATWNGGAERMFGYSAGEAVGRHISLLIPPERQYEEAEILERLGRGERMEHFETVRITKSDRRIDVSLTVSPIKNRAGNIVGASKIVRDITARKKAEASMARQAEELARSNLELERFAYVASHDLQEPMRTVQSFAQLLQRHCKDTVTGDAEEYLRFVVGGVQRMQALIVDLLAYSRVGSQGGAFAPADCKEILAKVLDNLRASIESNNAAVTVDPLPVVVGDATQLGQVFQNLVVNAIKFHGQRTPEIRVSAKETPGGWVFSVADNGIGIAAEYFERIFIIFQRLHTIEEYGGTGIGLAICKKVAERHGGRIWVESVMGEGSTFYFSVPKREKTT